MDRETKVNKETVDKAFASLSSTNKLVLSPIRPILKNDTQNRVADERLRALGCRGHFEIYSAEGSKDVKEKAVNMLRVIDQLPRCLAWKRVAGYVSGPGSGPSWAKDPNLSIIRKAYHPSHPTNA